LVEAVKDLSVKQPVVHPAMGAVAENVSELAKASGLSDFFTHILAAAVSMFWFSAHIPYKTEG